MGWRFSGPDALDDAAVVVAVEGIELTGGTPRLRVVHLNQAAGRMWAVPPGPVHGGPASLISLLTHRDDAERIIGVATTGRPQSWVSRQDTGWFEQRAVPLGPDLRTSAPGSGPPHVLVVTRAVGRLPRVGADGGSSRATLVAQAIQQARLFDVRLEANLALQHALLPPNLPEVSGIDLAARYRPGSGNEVGGDWYDVVRLPSGRTAFVIGDVQGHDLAAAAMMGQVRSVVRAYLLDEQPPTAVLGSVNGFVLSLGLDRLVTACIVLAHPGSRLITVASAGLAGPVLLRLGLTAELMRIQPGPPLGALDDVTWRERTTLLPVGTTMMLHTGGLIERRNRSYADGERQLLEGSAALTEDDVEQLADDILTLAGIPPAEGGRPAGPRPAVEDDTALLLLRWSSVEGPVADHARALPVTPSSAAIARWYVDDLLLSWGVAEKVREVAVLLADELIANAVRHAHRSIVLDVSADRAQVRVEVFDDGHRAPKLLEDAPNATSGRGLRLVDALADAWGVRTSQGDLGKTVWFTLERPAD